MNTFKKIIIISVIIIIILVGLIIMLIEGNHTQQNPANTPVPVVTQYQPQNSPPAYQVILPTGSAKKFVDKVNSKDSLSDADKQIKQKLISLSNPDSGNTYQNPLFTVWYRSVLDIFEVEITTTDINTARNSAAQWFISQGLSSDGVCKLPVSFYLNQDVKNQIRGQNILFNPFPDNCQ